MPKGGAGKIEQRDAWAIAKKLGADERSGPKHDVISIRYDGTIIASYGIRRDKTAPHDYIAKQIFISLNETQALARCTLSAEKYYSLLKKKQKLPT